jgi:hypothetical protein
MFTKIFKKKILNNKQKYFFDIHEYQAKQLMREFKINV